MFIDLNTLSTKMNSNKSSPVWKYFKIDSVDNKKAVCIQYNAKISRGGAMVKSFTTSNLIAYLRSQHAGSYYEYEALLASNPKGSAASSSSSNSIGLGSETVYVSHGEPLQMTIEQCTSMKETR
jgi:hypothetical protein